MANLKFQKEWTDAVNKTNKAIENAIKGASLELFGEIVRKTPVGNPILWRSRPPLGYVGGRLRGNWQVGLRQPIQGEIGLIDPSGSSAIATGQSTIRDFKLNDGVIWFSNNLPYAQKIEDGWSQQRPQGMVKTTIKQFQPILERIAKVEKI